MRLSAGARRDLICVLVVAVVGVVASAGLWSGPGILNTRAGGDSPFLVQRVYELVASLRAGAFPARWMPDAAYGLGYPFFNYYAALPYYLAAGLNALGVDLLVAIQLTQTAGMLAAGLAMWWWARGRLPGAGPALAAIAYIVAPFHLVNVYVRGDSLSEFYAFVWFPLILRGIERAAGRGGWRNVLGLGGAIAGLALTHNVSAMLFAPFCAVWALVAVAGPPVRGWRARAAVALRLAAAVAVGMAWSAWFWFPALAEAGGAQLGVQTTGYFNYAEHFRGADLVQAGLAFDYGIDAGRSPFAMGLVQALMIAAGAGAAVWGAARRRLPAIRVGMLVVGFAAATFMITPASDLIWRLVPPLALAQFPWRLLSIQALFGAALAGSLGALSDAPGPRRALAAASGAVLVAASLVALPSDRLNIASGDVTPVSVENYEWLSGNIGTTIRAEYLPMAATPRPRVGPAMTGQERIRALIGNVIASERLDRSPVGETWRVEVGPGAAQIVVPLLHWQGWSGALIAPSGERQRVALTPAPRLGWVSATLPEGMWRFEIRAVRSPAQQAGEAVSLTGVALVALLLAGRLIRDADARRRAARMVAAVALASAGLVALGWTASAGAARSAGGAPVFVDFTSRPFAHRGPVEVSVEGERFTLEAASVTPATSVRPGDLVTVTLQWREGRSPQGVSLQWLSPSYGLAGWPDSEKSFRIADRRTPLDNGVASLPVDDYTPAGPLVLRVIVENPSGRQTPVTALMGPRVMATPRPAPAVLATFAGLPIALESFLWQETEPGKICFRPTWFLRPEGGDAPLALKYSARLRGPDGRALAQVDQEPMQGFAPVWSWAPGAAVFDSACGITLAAGLNAGDAFEVELVWYDAATLEELARVSLRSRRLPGRDTPHAANATWVTGTP